MTRNPIVLGRPPMIRQANAEVLLRLLRESGPCSKADLVRASGLSAPSVTNVVATLTSAGLVETLGEGHSTGGRPPDILRFRAERGWVGAVDITHRFVRFLLADLDGRRLAQAEVPVDPSKSRPSDLCRQIAATFGRLPEQNRLRRTQLLRVTVGVPSIVNVEQGTVLALSAFEGWNQVSLGSLLSRELKCQVVVDNDTNLAAEGEFYCGAAKGEKDFVFITIGEGVGAGIFLGGRLYRGSQWSAGEIGYLRVPAVSREHPAIHKYGKLERALSASGILNSWRTGGYRVRTKLPVKSVGDVWDLAAAGHVGARRILNQRAAILEDVILDLALILNPGLILLGGEAGNHPALLEELQSLLEGSEFAVARVALGSLGTTAVLWGGIATALEPTILRLLEKPARSGSRTGAG